MKRQAKYVIDALVIAAVIAGIYFIVIYGPTRIVELMGVKNGYLVLLISGFLSGFTTLDTFFFPPAVITLVIGGLNPIAAGIFTGIGVTVSNLVFYFFGHGGRKLGEDSKKFKRTTKALLKWLEKAPSWAVPISLWFYATALPLPNVAVIASAGIINYPFRKLILPFLLGNITHVIIISYIGIRVFS